MESRSVRNLCELSSSELKSFLDSFDNVLCDCDGVLYIRYTEISGSFKTVSKLRSLGKRIGAVSNNTINTAEAIHDVFSKLGCEIDVTDIVLPAGAMCRYFQKIGFKKEIYFLGTQCLKNELIRAGLKIADPGEPFVKEQLSEIVKNLNFNENVGAVVFDVDFNCTYMSMARAAMYLQRPNMLYVVGASDKLAPIGLEYPLMVPGYLQECIEEFTGNKRILVGKPGAEFNEYLCEKFGIKDTSRSLFVGDSLSHDIKFAKKHGYQSLLVLTGTSSLEETKSCPSDMVPDFYTNCLGDIYKLITEKLNM